MTIKRLLIIIGIILILIIGVSTYTLAILLPDAARTSLSMPASTPVGTITTQISSVYRVEGTIQSLGNHTFAIALTNENKTLTISVNDKTTYSTPNGSATFNDLRVGEIVEVRSRTDALNTTTILAVRVIVKSAVA